MKKITRGFSEICGALMGDGWIQSNESNLFIAGNPKEDKFYYDNHLVPLINKELNLNIKARLFPYWRVYGISIHRKSIIKIFLNVGIPKGRKARIVRIPSVFKKSKNLFLPLLRGIFDTDGSIYFMRGNPKNDFHIRPRLRITSVSKKLIEDIKTLSRSIEIKHSNPKALKWGKNPNPSYIFEINRVESISRWFKLIGTKNPVHQTKIDIWKRFGFVPPKTSLNERFKILKGLVNPKSFY